MPKPKLEGRVVYKEVLLNGEGAYCHDYPSLTKGDKVPPGCFVMSVTVGEYALLRDGFAYMLADGSLHLRKGGSHVLAPRGLP